MTDAEHRGIGNKEWFVNKLHSLIYKLENTGDSDFQRSGEASFIKSISDIYKNKYFLCFDVGANNGEYTELILESVKSDSINVHLFEPQKKCFNLLSEKFNSKKNIVINNVGLSDNISTSTLYKDSDQSPLASVYKRDLERYQINTDVTETIHLETGENYVKGQNILKINLLKIDVEGHEFQVLKGFGDFLQPEHVDFIQFEYGGTNLDSHTSLLEIHNYLTKKGFIVCKMMRNHLEIRPYHPRLENFIYQNWVAVSPKIIEASQP